jgi:hypothetical protein
VQVTVFSSLPAMIPMESKHHRYVVRVSASVSESDCRLSPMLSAFVSYPFSAVKAIERISSE